MKDLKIFTENIEQVAIDQINELMNLDAFRDSKVRIMPDVHSGSGCVIGFTADLGPKVIPNIVGVDISCGMRTVELGNIDLDLIKLNEVIKNYVPNGTSVHEGRVVRFSDLQKLTCFRELKDTKRIERSIGTLGGGNHFIEIDIDANGNKYLIIHSGSRNLGSQVASYHQDLAYEIMRGKDKLIEEKAEIIRTYKEQGRKTEIQAALKAKDIEYVAMEINIPKDLCYLEGKYREDYLHDMQICQDYAELNRATMAKIILEELGLDINSPSFETVHNYIDIKTNIVRKGAISAKLGEKVIIPINMRDGCILATGKGNDDWNQSAPHGAGRILSRTKAKEQLKFSDYEASMEGIFTTCVNESTLDEAPMVYKNIDEIIANTKDTIDIIDILKPIYNFKASDKLIMPNLIYIDGVLTNRIANDTLKYGAGDKLDLYMSNDVANYVECVIVKIGFNACYTKTLL